MGKRLHVFAERVQVLYQLLVEFLDLCNLLVEYPILQMLLGEFVLEVLDENIESFFPLFEFQVLDLLSLDVFPKGLLELLSIDVYLSPDSLPDLLNDILFSQPVSIALPFVPTEPFVETGTRPRTAERTQCW